MKQTPKSKGNWGNNFSGRFIANTVLKLFENQPATNWSNDERSTSLILLDNVQKIDY